MPPYNIAFYGTLSFLAGIFAAGSAFSALWAVLFFSSAASVFYLAGKCGLSEAAFFIFVFAFGIFYYGFFYGAEKSAQKINFGENVSFSGIVSAEPQLSEKYQRITLALYPPFAGNISVLAPLSPEINYGDIVDASGEISEPDSPNGGPVSFFPKLKIAGSHRGSGFREGLLDFKESVIGQFKKFLPGDSAALLSGLTLGWRGDFTDELKKEMSLSGTTHMVALSGYNITILVVVVAGIFGYWLSRRMTFWLTSTVILFFIMMVGAEPSVVRAAIMGFLALFAKEAGRRYSVRNAMALTAGAMVFADPGTLFEIGFILSFLSLAGIVWLEPALADFLHIDSRKKSFMSWRENALATLSAQLAVAPVLMAVFGTFSLTSIIANVLILELIPLTMLLGFLLAIFGWIFYYSGFLISLLENILLQYELGVIKLFAAWNVPVLPGFGSWAFFGIYYLALISFVFYRQKEMQAELL